MGLGKEVQIRSRQDWERGLRGGEIEGNTRGRAGARRASRGAAEGMETAADWVVYSEGRSVLLVSVMDPWKFRMELTQQAGSEDESGRVRWAPIGQQACAGPWLEKQRALNPESCTRKTTSKI
jgi:hypothetical protein